MEKIDQSFSNDGSQHNGSIIADSYDLFEYGEFRKYLEVDRPDLDLFLLGIPFRNIRSLGEMFYSSHQILCTTASNTFELVKCAPVTTIRIFRRDWQQGNKKVTTPSDVSRLSCLLSWKAWNRRRLSRRKENAPVLFAITFLLFCLHAVIRYD